MAMQTSVVIRMELQKEKVMFVDVAQTVQRATGDIVAIDVIRSSKEKTTRDITVEIADTHIDTLLQKLRELPGITIRHVSDRTFLVHLGGKISVQPKQPIKNREELSRVYTPGVARVCEAIREEPDKAFTLTMKRNSVAVISDGTAVLGLGDIGPLAALPVMEGKAMLFKQLADIDAFPLCLDETDPEQLVTHICKLAPSFGGINLEDISSPRCFYVEEQLKQKLDIPVFHDDQHGTAVVMLAGLLNALKIVGKAIEQTKVVLIGAGAAGIACSKMLLEAQVGELIVVDRHGALVDETDYNNDYWNWLARHTNPKRVRGGVRECLNGADVVIGVSAPGVLTVEDIRQMAAEPIVFALANPRPEIEPDVCEREVRVMATGRSDYPNQINNVLCFPGIFRGALDCRATAVTNGMKLAAAEAIAEVVSDSELNEQYIIPSIFNDDVVSNVRRKVIQAAMKEKVARRVPRDIDE